MTRGKQRLIVILILNFMIAIFSLLAVELKFKGLVQTWFSYAEQDVNGDCASGFTLRRVRFKPYGSFSKSIKWILQVGWDKQTPRLLDAYIDFHLSKELNIRVGQYTVPGAISSSLTSSANLDFVERAAITQKWGSNNGLSSYCSPGIQIYGKFLREKLYYAFMLANPKTYGIFTPSVINTNYDSQNNGATLWGRIEASILKGLRFGTFFGIGKENDTGMKRSSYGVHLFFLKNPVNFKIEYIAGQFGLEGNESKYSGMYGVLGYKINKVEPMVRCGFYTPDDGKADNFGVKKYNNISIGINYFYSKNIKFQANYVIRKESLNEGLDQLNNNIFYINLQYKW